MSLLKMLEQAGGGKDLTQLSRQLGLDVDTTGKLVAILAPAIGSAAKKRAGSRGLTGLLNLLKGDAQRIFFESPDHAATPEAQAQGRRFLEILLGSNDATDILAKEAAQRSGVDLYTVQRFLPSLAAILQGGMQMRMPDTTIQDMQIQLNGGVTNQGGGFMAMLQGRLSTQNKDGPDTTALMNILGADGDSSEVDNVLDRVMK